MESRIVNVGSNPTFITKNKPTNKMIQQLIEIRNNILSAIEANDNILAKMAINDLDTLLYKVNNEKSKSTDVLEDTPFHKPDFSHLKVQTAVDWLIEQLVNRQNGEITTLSHLSLDQIYNQAKVIQQEHIEDAFDDGVSDVLKNFDKAYSDIDGETYYKQNFK